MIHIFNEHLIGTAAVYAQSVSQGRRLWGVPNLHLESRTVREIVAGRGIPAVFSRSKLVVDGSVEVIDITVLSGMSHVFKTGSPYLVGVIIYEDTGQPIDLNKAIVDGVRLLKGNQ